jgi:hypothetical protein
LGPNASTPEDLFDNSNGDEEHEVEVVHCAKKNIRIVRALSLLL